MKKNPSKDKGERDGEEQGRRSKMDERRQQSERYTGGDQRRVVYAKTLSSRDRTGATA